MLLKKLDYQKIERFLSAALLLMGIFYLLNSLQSNDVPRPYTVLDEAAGTRNAYISGGVLNPGVYEITSGMTILELIEAAGGLSQDVNKQSLHEDINLAQRVVDEDHIFIPITQEIPTEDGKGSTTLININTATSGELQSLPGIGEATAAKIIEARPFDSIEKLNEVNGIGEKKFNDIKPLVTL